MRAINNLTQFENKRLLSISEAAGYLGIGHNKARKWLEEIGAKRKLGSRSLYDKQIIDKVLNDMKEA